MKYLVDTDWVIDYLKGKSLAVETLTNFASDGLAISLITYGEIYEGIYFSRDPQSAEKIFRQFLRLVKVLALNRQTMKRFARLRGTLRRQGRLIGDPDILIAATALHHNLMLLSRNQSDFERIPQLQLWKA
jgi:tRNA(fMet)-specific endonuclease VapC